MGDRNRARIGSKIWVVVPARKATQPCGIGALESILGPLKSFKIPPQSPSIPRVREVNTGSYMYFVPSDKPYIILTMFEGGMLDWKKDKKYPVLAGKLFSVYTEAEFLEVIETKFLAIHSHLY
jgi:hypothetical protein